MLRHTVLPTFQFTPDYVGGALALLGTTLTSYVYYWETIEQEEERPSRRELGAVQWYAAAGVVFTTLIFWFILVSTAATAGVQGTRVETAQDAAAALVPLAGTLAEELFAVGLLASALLSLPVLAATTGYVVMQAFDGTPSIEEPVRSGTRPFYGVMAVSLAAGLALSYMGIEPIQLLYMAGIAGGIGSPVLLVLLLLAAGDREVMGETRNSGFLRAWGWFAALAVSAASLLYVWMQLTSSI